MTHPLDRLAGTTEISNEAFELPVFEYREDLQAMPVGGALKKAAVQPYEAFWLKCRVPSEGLMYDCFIKVMPLGIWSMLLMPALSDGERTIDMGYGPYKVRWNAQDRGETDRDIFGAYEQCMARLADRRERETNTVQRPGRNKGRPYRKAQHVVIGDKIAGGDRSHAGDGTGSPRSPHDRRAHTRTLRSGRVIQVRSCSIHGGADKAPLYKV